MFFRDFSASFLTSCLRFFDEQAQQVGIMTEEYSFLITSIDTTNLDLEDFFYSGAKITTFRLVEDSNQELVSLLQDWEYLRHKTGDRVIIPAPTKLMVCGKVIKMINLIIIP